MTWLFSAETTDSKTRLVGVELNYTKVCLNAEIKKKLLSLEVITVIRKVLVTETAMKAIALA